MSVYLSYIFKMFVTHWQARQYDGLVEVKVHGWIGVVGGAEFETFH